MVQDPGDTSREVRYGSVPESSDVKGVKVLASDLSADRCLVGMALCGEERAPQGYELWAVRVGLQWGVRRQVTPIASFDLRFGTWAMIGLEKFSEGSVLANAIRSQFRGWEGS